MKKTRVLKIVFLLLCSGAFTSVSYAHTSYLSDTIDKSRRFSGAVKKQMQAGDQAFSLEQYVVAVDRYKRALEKESRDTVKIQIMYKLGLAQRKLNHPKEACDEFVSMWKFGERSEGFLRIYASTLQMLSMYGRMEEVVDTMERYNMNGSYFRAVLKMLGEKNDSLLMLSRSDIVYDTGINTAFSEYGMAIIEDELVFSSTRALPKETIMDPRTGHGYSRLYSARYRPEYKDWAYPNLLQGVTLTLPGNIGTFSYDSIRNIAYFMWSQANKSGIYTIKRQSDGSWGELAEFELNYNQGATSFEGKVGHPSISADGNRLLFVVKDVDLGSSTDVWFVERTEKSQVVSTKKRRGVSSPSKSAQAKTRQPSKKKGSTAVIVNSEWEMPIRLNEKVNTSAVESFPQWLDRHTFSFASDGLVGYGGLDLFLANMDSNFTTVKEVMHLPSPINSSFDDHGLIVDRTRKSILFSSNRYVGPGQIDNIYTCSKTGVALVIEGELRDSISGELISDYEVSLKGDNGIVLYSQKGEDFRFSFPAVGSGAYTLTAIANNYDTAFVDFKTDEVSSILPVVMRRDVKFTMLYKSEPSDGMGMDMGYSLADVPEISEDVVLSDTSSAIADVAADVAAVPTVEETTTDITENITENIEPTISTDSDLSKTVDINTASGYESFALSVGKSEVQDLSMFMNDSLTPKEIIDSISKHRKDIEKVDSRYVNEYKQRVNDPLRRAKLQVVPPGVKCEVCENKENQREVGTAFYVRTNDDKALITMTDNAGNVSYIDLAPNAAYSVEVSSIATAANNPSLPKSVQMSDVIKTVVTRDYIVFECAPKLSELNDETYVNNLYFDFDKDSLIKDATRELDRMIIIAIKNPNMMFEIEAHADERGSVEYNKDLTDKRLDRAVSYIEKKGFDTERIVGKSYGKSMPLLKNAKTDQEHAFNRRVSFSLFNPQAENELLGKPYSIEESKPVFSNEVYFRVQLGAFRRPLEEPLSYYSDVIKFAPEEKISYYMDKDGLYKYNLGSTYSDIKKVRELAKKVIDNNRECYIAAFYKGNRITVAEALAIINNKK